MTRQKPIDGRRKGETDMTEGSIIRHLLVFAAPLLIGNLFQQLYNTVDMWVVGNFVSNEAFSAVGSVASIVNMLIGFFSGLASGAGVVISQYYGAGKPDKVKKAVHTSLVMTFFLSLAITLLGVLLTPLLLGFMKMPPEVFPEAKAYLTIYFSGLIGLLFYNMGAGILRAVGDSRRPFYFLVVSTLTNIVLDQLFVNVFHLGVKGVAYATILSQGISALLVMTVLFRTSSCVRASISSLRIDGDILKMIVRVGVPAGLQLTITAFSNVFVQSYINYFGADCMSGWAAYSKVDGFLFLPMQSISIAATTFVGQNLGKGNAERAKKGVRVALVMAFAATLLFVLPVMILAPRVVAFFNDKPAVVTYGTMLLRYISLFYLLCCINQIYAGALRGSGNSRAPMVIMLASFVLFRQCYLFVVSHYISNTLLPIAFGYPAGWLVCSLSLLLYYRKKSLTGTRLIEAGADA